MNALPEFVPFPKLSRLSRDIIVTEKIDGTNAQVVVTDDGHVLAGSRTRWITPEADNFGFARWVQEHADELRLLGPGQHFGEWWGQGIQRGYGLTEKRFSLFNVSRWHDARRVEDPPPFNAQRKSALAPACCHVVPVLAITAFDTSTIDSVLDLLRRAGSQAARGFMQPEGIVVFHTASGQLFKKTLGGDGHKGQQAMGVAA